MPYTQSDVFVQVDLSAALPQVQAPFLLPVSLGEHYFVKQGAFVAEVAGDEVDPFAYPGLPSSQNVADTPLVVDASGDFAPTFYVLTEDGGDVDVTGEIAATGSQFTISGDVPAGALFVSYRARDDRYAGAQRRLLRASSLEDLTTLFGADGLGPANPLGYAMWKSYERGQVSVGGVAVTDALSGGVGSYTAPLANEVLAYADAIDYLRLVEEAYAITPLTENAAVIDLLHAHVKDMSSLLGRSERRAFCAPSMSGGIVVRGGSEYDVWRPIVDNVAGGATVLADAMAALSVGQTYVLGGYPVIKAGASEFYAKGAPAGTLTSGGNDFDVTEASILVGIGSSAVAPAATRVKSSDAFRGYIDGVSFELAIEAIGIAGDASLLRLSNSGGDGDGAEGGAYQFVRTIDPVTDRSGYIAAYKQLARSYQSERLVLVGPERIHDDSLPAPQDVPAYFAAAALAAECCRVGVQAAGQAPGVDPFSFTDSKAVLFRSSRYFTGSELADIEGAGWTLLVNDSIGARLTTQRSVTTNTNTVEEMEIILGVERDFASRYFRNELRKRLRRFRIEEQTIGIVGLVAGSVCTDLTDSTRPTRCFRSLSVTSVQQDEEIRDQIVLDLEGEQLYPFNKALVKMRIAA